MKYSKAKLPAMAAVGASLALIGMAACSRSNPDAGPAGSAPASNLPVEYALLLPAPNVPGPVIRRHPAHVMVDLEVRELVRHLANGVDYTFWTFGGNVPGLFIRVREGDLVEIRLHNHPTSKLPHNIDLHAVIGPGGGAASTITAPGHTSTFSFTALHPGLYVYHCGTAPVPMHVANGMYGLILVEPEDGLPPVDHEYYVMQGEVYTAGKYGEAGLQAFDPDKAGDERPAYVVFNGAVGSLVGADALKSKIGESVRVYFGNGGPNLTSSFHIIGEVLDKVYGDGGTRVADHDVQTVSVAPGSATIVEFRTLEPGTYTMVDHALSRAFGKGALGMLKVSGPENRAIYSGKVSDTDYGGTAPEVVAANSAPPPESAPLPAALDTEDQPGVVPTLEVRIERGRRVFQMACFACHQPNGLGLPGIFPPLAASDYIKADKKRTIRIPLKGLTGPIIVNGATYNSVMPPQAFTDRQIADVLTYVMNSWGNTLGSVSVDEVKQARESSQ